MTDNLPAINRVAVMGYAKLPVSLNEAAQVARYLQEQGIEATAGMVETESLRQRVNNGEFDLIIALGGDGTMLRAGQLGGVNNVPILGINLGHFGFLMEVQKDQWRECILNLLKGNYWLEKRMMLRTEHWHAGSLQGSWEVLNEAVVCRGQFVRPIQLMTSVDGRYLTTYVADGLIAATPTGSTAYALAVGGPILPPELRNILLVPVAPHLSIERAIVLAEGSYVSIEVKSDHQVVLSIDGQPPINLADGDQVNVRAGEHTVRFVRFQDPGYFYRNLTPHMNQNPSTGNHR